ncbi:MAG: hypothetical protein ACOCXJ_05860, partial [Planctomycetota bacterium]
TRAYVQRAVAGVSYDVLWHRPGPGLPAMGNLLMHLRGTEHEWIGVKVGGLPRRRQRAVEFSTDQEPGLQELLMALASVQAESDRVLAGLTTVDEHVTVCIHYTENHYAFHAGQLCLLRRLAEPAFQLYP